MTHIIPIPLVDFNISASSNETAIYVTWITDNSTFSHVEYYWMICFNADDRQVASADVEDGNGYVVGGLVPGSRYNVCVTAVTYQDRMDTIRCVLVWTTGKPPVREVNPPRDDTGVFLLIVVAVPVACLLLVLIIVCVAVIVVHRRRRRRDKPAEAEMTSSSTCDSSTGNCGPTSSGLSSPLSEQSVTTMNMYDEVMPMPSAPPLREQHDVLYWNIDHDPLPLQSSLSLNIYDDALSY